MDKRTGRQGVARQQAKRKKGGRLAEKRDTAAKALNVPHEVAADEAAFEIARVWIGRKKMYVGLSVGRYLQLGRKDEPAIWGVILADLSRHVARGLREDFNLDEDATLRELRASLDKELNKPTSRIT